MGYLTAVCAIAFLVRIIPRLFAPSPVTDTYFHLSVIPRLKKDGWMKVSKALHYYPLGYDWLLSLLPGRLVKYWERINGAVFDALQVLLFVWVLSVFADIQDPDVVWIWGPLLLALSPAWLSLGRGPRAYHGTPRVFAEFLVSCICVCLLLFQTTGEVWWWGLSVLGGGCLLVSSKFGAQVLLFFCVITGLFHHNLSILSVPLFSGVVAYGLSLGRYGSVLRGHLNHLMWYARSIRKDAMFVAQKNSWHVLRQRYAREGIKGFLLHFFSTNSLGAGFYQHQMLWFVLTVSLVQQEPVPIPDYLRHWLYAGISMWFLTSLRPFLFLGTAERYLFAIAISEYFIITQWLAISPPVWRWVMLAYSVALWLSYTWRFRIEYRGYYLNTPDRKAMIAFLNEIKSPMRLLSFDKSPAWDLAYKTNHAHFMTLPEFGHSATWDDVFAFDTYPKWQAVRLLDIDLLVINKDALLDAVHKKVRIEFPFIKMEKLFENNPYQVYRIPGHLKLKSLPEARVDVERPILPQKRKTEDERMIHGIGKT